MGERGIVGVTMKDFDVEEFGWLLGFFPERLPVSDSYKSRRPESNSEPDRTEQRHMVEWFSDQATTGSGLYRRNEPNRSARITYQRLMSAAGLLWMAEALELPESQVRQAQVAALAEDDFRSAVRVIREIIPWEDVAERAQEELQHLKALKNPNM